MKGMVCCFLWSGLACGVGAAFVQVTVYRRDADGKPLGNFRNGTFDIQKPLLVELVDNANLFFPAEPGRENAAFGYQLRDPLLQEIHHLAAQILLIFALGSLIEVKAGQERMERGAADMAVGFIVIPNMIAPLLPSPKFFKILKDYRAKLSGKQ